MTCSRHLATAALLLAGINSAQASFELMYLQDATTGKISRWDPINKISLGQFGYPDSGVLFDTISARQGTNAYTGGFNGSRAFNPNTGILVGANAGYSVFNTVTPSGNMLIGHNSSSHWRYTTNFTGLVGVAGSFTNRLNTLPIDDNRAWVTGIHSDGSLAWQIIDFSTGTASPVQAVIGAANLTPSTNFYGFGARVVGANGIARMLTPYLTNTGQHRVLVQELNAGETSVITSFTFGGMTGFSTSAALSVMPAHDGFWVVGNDSAAATTTRFMRFEWGGFNTANYTTTAIDVPTTKWQGANVVAPEPGVLLGLGAGVLGFLRRGKKIAAK